MKLAIALLLLTTTTPILANPARPDCGQTKTFTASNDCGLSYGGTWIACASGMRAVPTFTMPACPYTTTIPPSNTPSPAITPTPTASLLLLYANRKINTTTTSCFRQLVCIDALASCGGTGTRFGGCYDMCTPSHSPTAPACTVTESAAGAVETGGVGREAERKKEPEREQLAECDEKPYLCAPADW